MRTSAKYVLSAILISQASFSKEVFTPDMVGLFMVETNPYVYSLVGARYVEEAKITSQKGKLDFVLGSSYEKKDYPLGQSEYFDLEVSKSMESGVQFTGGYRMAQGVQEFNNVKTGSEGEAKVGAKLPLVGYLMGMNKTKFAIESSKMDFYKSGFEAEDRKRLFYGQVMGEFYEMMYRSELFDLSSELLQRSLKRDAYISKKVGAGALGGMSALDSARIVEGARQLVFEAENLKKNATRDFARHLNLTYETFVGQYAIGRLSQREGCTGELSKSLKKAFDNRPDLKSIEQENAKISLEESLNELSSLPDIDLGVYGVRDGLYGDGAKVAIGFSFPIQRRGYEGKKLELVKRKNLNVEKRTAREMDIKARLENLHGSLDAASRKLKSAKREAEVLEKLRLGEVQRFEAGSSTIFVLNQREMDALEGKRKVLAYLYEISVLEELIKVESASDLPF